MYLKTGRGFFFVVVTLLIIVNLPGVHDLWQCLSSAACASLNTQEINKYQTHYLPALRHWWVLKAG